MTIRRGSMLVIAFLLASPGTAAAWGSDCKFTADRSASADMRGVERVEIFARAGDLTVKPATGTMLSASGRACASNEKYLEQTQVKLRRDGNVLQVQVQVPEEMQGIGIFYASLDLTVAAPATLPVEITDSSGDMTLEAVRVTRITDSSGDILAKGLPGDVEIEDSSGDIRIEQVSGNVRIDQDSSGQVKIAGVQGTVNIP